MDYKITMQLTKHFLILVLNKALRQGDLMGEGEVRPWNSR